MHNLKSKIRNKKKGFSLTEIIITLGVFFLLASTGITIYFNYYRNSMTNADVDNVMTLIKNTRFNALKNPTNSNYGIRIDQGLNSVIGFAGTYTPGAITNKTVKLNSLRIMDLNISPNIGVTNEIIFQNMTGKTVNTGSFVVANDYFNFTFNINSLGVIN